VSAPTLREKFSERFIPEPNSGCWIWTAGFNARDGYGRFKINGKERTAHRSSYIIHRGPVEGGMDVCHKCDTRLCVNPDHLFVGTRKENMNDCIRKGRFKYPVVTQGIGHHRGMRKLSDAQVIEVLKLTKIGGLSDAAIARMFSVCEETVRKIRLGRSFKHLTQEHNEPANA